MRSTKLFTIMEKTLDTQNEMILDLRSSNQDLKKLIMFKDQKINELEKQNNDLVKSNNVLMGRVEKMQGMLSAPFKLSAIQNGEVVEIKKGFFARLKNLFS